MTKLKILFWELTGKCNLNCLHCRSKEDKREELSLAEIEEVAKQLRDFASPLIILSGGEPLLRCDIFKIIYLLSSYNFSIALATNGTLINREIAYKISKSKVKVVSVSLDGATAETHNKIRRNNRAFSLAISGINYLKEAKVKVQINFTIMPDNIREVEEVLSLARNLGVSAVHFFLLVPVGRGRTVAPITSFEYEELLHRILKLKKTSGLQLRVTCAPAFKRIEKEMGEEIENFTTEERGCSGGINVAFISATGELCPCGYFPLSVGNLKEKDFTELWNNSLVFNQLRNFELLKGGCKSCLYNKICGGCRARAYLLKGDYLECDPLCIFNSKEVRNNGNNRTKEIRNFFQA